jgi:ABC-type transporter Mla maintaining outer membrane lipid asymmetry permease subunit MlaE
MKNDKKKHFVAGLLVAALVALPCYLESVNLFAGLWAAVFATVIAGGVKEYTDYCHTKHWDWRDFGCTCLGAAVIVLLILGLHYGKG